MALDVSSDIVIHRPRAAVAEYVFDPTNLPQWRSDVLAVRREHAGPATVGARFVVRSKGRLRAANRLDEIVALDPLTSTTLRTIAGGTPLDTQITLAPELRNSTRVTVRTTGDVGSISAPLLGRTLRRTTGVDLARLKTILELDRH